MQEGPGSTPEAGGLTKPSILSQWAKWGAACIQWVTAAENCIVTGPNSFPLVESIWAAGNTVILCACLGPEHGPMRLYKRRKKAPHCTLMTISITIYIFERTKFVDRQLLLQEVDRQFCCWKIIWIINAFQRPSVPVPDVLSEYCWRCGKNRDVNIMF